MTAPLAPVAALLGVPLDLVDEATAARRIEEAILARRPLFLSTPNLNFLIACQDDSAFRQSVLASELSVADGMPLFWMARWLGIPLPQRVAGSSLFQRLATGDDPPTLRIAFFGGPPGVAEAACARLNAAGGRLRGCAAIDPGFGSLDDLGSPRLLDAVRAAGADFLVVALGAAKGQAWILRHRGSLGVPVVSHLGAVVNFVAGTVRRAPAWVQRAGLEWLWRIKEEPALWRRYLGDGLRALRLVVGNVLPHGAWLRWHRPQARRVAPHWTLDTSSPLSPRLQLGGAFCGPLPEALLDQMAALVDEPRCLTIDLAGVGFLDPLMAGALLRLIARRGQRGVRMAGASPAVGRLLRWNGLL